MASSGALKIMGRYGRNLAPSSALKITGRYGRNLVPLGVFQITGRHGLATFQRVSNYGALRA